MKQLLQNLRTGATRLVDVPIPSPKPGTALVRTAASLVSTGTERMLVEFAEKSLLGKARSRPDLLRQVLEKARREGVISAAETAFNRLEQDIPLGYSSAGTIVSLGENVHDFQVGQRVVCAGGGFAVHAEYALVPRNLLALLPDHVDFDSGAFATVGAVAMHGFRLADCQIGSRVAVIGLGLLGLLTSSVAMAAGCHVMGIDLDPSRVDRAKQLGCEAVLRERAEEVARTFSRGRGVDAVLICADTPSNDPLELAGDIARDRAHLVAIGAVGLNVPRKVFYEKELSLINSRSYGPGRYDPEYEEGGHDYPLGYVRWTEGRNLKAFVDLLASNRLDVKSLITHRFHIDRALEAYDLITGKRGDTFLGVLLSFPDKVETPTNSDVQIMASEVGQIKRARTIQLGVLGAGNFATAVLLPMLKGLQNVELIGIAAPSGVSAERAARRYEFQYATSDEARVLNDPDINCMAILTRHNIHAQLIVQALKSGKHVFCEKPLAINRNQLKELKDHWHLVKDMGLMITIGFNRRFAPQAERLTRFLSDSKEPSFIHYRVNAGFLPPDHWLHDPEQGGGRIIGEACHFVDFLTYLVGSPPQDVTAHSLLDGGRYQNDNVQLTFTFPDGSIGTVAYLANGDKSYPKERVEVFKGGRIGVLNDFRSLEMVWEGRRKTDRSRFRQDKGHRALWASFIEAIQTGGSPPIPYQHIFGVTRATFAAMEALRTGGRVASSPR